jgi:hypothetical protein
VDLELVIVCVWWSIFRDRGVLSSVIVPVNVNSFFLFYLIIQLVEVARLYDFFFGNRIGFVVSFHVYI